MHTHGPHTIYHIPKHVAPGPYNYYHYLLCGPSNDCRMCAYELRTHLIAQSNIRSCFALSDFLNNSVGRKCRAASISCPWEPVASIWLTAVAHGKNKGHGWKVTGYGSCGCGSCSQVTSQHVANFSTFLPFFSVMWQKLRVSLQCVEIHFVNYLQHEIPYLKVFYFPC